jgi:TRAP-type mannitol/chloroaromatic compound transport system substrate-binding protein
MTQETQKTGRRNLLKGAAVAASAMSVPMISTAQTTSWRFQSTWPAKDIFHEFAQDFAKKVNDMTGNRLKIEVLPAGSVVPAFQLLDAVSKGTLDGGHGVIAYWYGKSQAVALWGSDRPLAWMPIWCWPGTTMAEARSCWTRSTAA